MSGKSSEELAIRAMRADEVALALDWAAAEGWNPGLGDDKCFAAVDPGGFLIGEHEGKPAAIISTVNYDDRFAFLGFYIVRPELRGRGFGLQIWKAGLAHAGRRAVGLDGVIAQQDNYGKSGFKLAYNNIRYGGVPMRARRGGGRDRAAVGAAVRSRSWPRMRASFPAARPLFWRAWLGAPGHRGAALMRDGSLAAWGVIRPCRKGRKIGPLVADDREAAEAVFCRAGGGRGRARCSSTCRSPMAPRRRAGDRARARPGVRDRAHVQGTGSAGRARARLWCDLPGAGVGSRRGRGATCVAGKRTLAGSRFV